MKLYYFTYGSNLHPVRIRKRIPSASLVGAVELPGRSISFSKRSRDGSGKCTIATAQKSQSVFGAIYEIDAQEKFALDRIEGVGAGYDLHWEELEVNGSRIRAFVYIASRSHVDGTLQPYHWYKDLVLAGARHHRFPSDYIDVLKAVEATGDLDATRQRDNEAILAEILKDSAE